ncbi:MAG: S8 family serine peptidase [Candidatus Nomurabacteria bacterium]|nr:S8 family serine peptidase [Candidatus Nomurabacteria bacterium]
MILLSVLLFANLANPRAIAILPATSETQRVVVVYKTPPLPTFSRDSIYERMEVLDNARDDLEKRVNRATNFELEQTFDNFPVMVITTDTAGVESLKSDPNVEGVFYDMPLEVFDTYRSPFTAIGGNLDARPSMPAYSDGADLYAGNDYEIVVIDTGILSSHAVFNGKIAAEACFSFDGSEVGIIWHSLCPSGKSFSTSVGSAEECTLAGCGHGTMTAGAAVMGLSNISNTYRTSGAAPQAKVIPIKVVTQVDTTISGADNPCGGSTSTCAVPYTSSILNALDHVVTLTKTHNQIAVVNLSMGFGAFASVESCKSDVSNGLYDLVKNAVSSLKKLGIATVVATGNNGSDSANRGKIAFPACVEGAIAVSATDPYDDKIASYAQNGALTTFLAPGGAFTNAYHYMWLPTSDGSFGGISGTSFAAPTVAGAYAVLRSKYPNATVDQLTNLLTATGKTVTDARSGYNSLQKPLIQVNKALAVPAPNMPTTDHIYVKNGTALKSFIDSLNYPFEYKVKNTTPDIDFASGRTPYAMAATMQSLANNPLLPTGASLQLTSYSVDGAVNRSYDIIVRGDLNQDAAINITDLVQLSRHMAGVNSLFGASLLASDTNKDGASNITDLVQISRHIAKVKEISE